MKLYRAGDVEISPDRREARRADQPLRLRPMAFDLLLYLVTNRDRVVPKEELIEQVWKGTTVTENSLMQCVGELRKVLEDDARQPTLIKTIAKSGYRFIGEVEEVESSEERGQEAPRAPGGPPHRWVAIAAGLVAVIAVSALWARPKSPPALTDNLEALRYYTQGVQKAKQLHTKEAIPLFEKAIALDGGFAMAHARLGYVYAIAGSRLDQGKPHLDRAVHLPSRLREQDRLYVAAWSAQANVDYEAAIRSFRDLIARFPEELEAHQQLGALFIGEERYDEAAKYIQAAIKIDPSAPENYNLLCDLSLATLKFDEGVAAAERFVALAWKEANSYDTLGLAHAARGNFPDAENAFRSALKIQPNFEIAIVHLAGTLARMGRYREAIEQYQHYIQNASVDWERERGYDEMASILRLRGERAKAEEAARNNPTGGTAILLALDRHDQRLATELLVDRARETERGRRINQRFLLYLRGQVALETGNTEEALSCLRQALATRAPYWALNWWEESLGDALLKIGRLDEAIAEYKRVLKRYPSNALAWYHLGQAYERSGSHDQAREAFLKFLDLWKDADRDIPEWIAAHRSIG